MRVGTWTFDFRTKFEMNFSRVGSLAPASEGSLGGVCGGVGGSWLDRVVTGSHWITSRAF